jgi:hypothetical protein
MYLTLEGTQAGVGTIESESDRWIGSNLFWVIRSDPDPIHFFQKSTDPDTIQKIYEPTDPTQKKCADPCTEVPPRNFFSLQKPIKY